MAIDLSEVELEHVKFLRGSGYDFVCSGCNYVYRNKPTEGCAHCKSPSFLNIESVIYNLELGLN
ncbi:MAG: hypothetical protein ABIH28_00110 [archaeon]